jgi:hypothetical protein
VIQTAALDGYKRFTFLEVEVAIAGSQLLLTVGGGQMEATME